VEEEAEVLQQNFAPARI